MSVVDPSDNITLELPTWRFTGEKHMGLEPIFSGGVGGGAGWETLNRTSDLNLAVHEGWLAQELTNVAQS